MGRPQFTAQSRRPGDASVDPDRFEFDEGLVAVSEQGGSFTAELSAEDPEVLHSVFSAVSSFDPLPGENYQVRVQDSTDPSTVYYEAELPLTQQFDPNLPIPVPPQSRVKINTIMDDSRDSNSDGLMIFNVATSEVTG